MPRYIDAEILKKALSHYGSEDVIYRDEIEMYIEDTPTADVVERKRGEWIAKPQEWYIGDTEWMCSKCKEQFSPIDMIQEDFFKMMKFCPHCGADMRGENNGKL